MSARLMQYFHNACDALAKSNGVEGSLPATEDANARRSDAVAALEATARSVVVDASGIVVGIGRVAAAQIPQLAVGTRLSDMVHIADQVAWMSALADFKFGKVDHSVKLRMNKASIGTPQAFSLFEFAHESARENLFRLDMWRSAEQAVSSKSEAHQGSEFVAMMSHEFRTPLNAILGFSGLLQHEVSTSLTDEQRAEYVTLIHGAAEHLLGLVNTILDVSKIGAGKYVVNCEPFDFGGAVKDATSMVSTLAQAKSVRLNVRAKTDDWRDVLADRRAIKQILINLLSNAVKYTPEHGCVTIDAWFEGATLAFEVSDTGIGMSEADQKRVFSPFCQIDNGTTREVEGTGLGLALVDGLVALHGGDISLKSAVGVGTKVTVRLPNARAANADAANSNQTAINGGSDGEKRQSA